jgi:transposase-like protein
MKKVLWSAREVKEEQDDDLAVSGLSDQDLDVRIALIQELIPLGLEAVHDQLNDEVKRLAGLRYSRKSADAKYRRWGKQNGSVFLMDQKLPIQVPRVRNVETDTEVPLGAYRRFQVSQKLDETILLRVLKGLSCRNYKVCAHAVPEAFGISSSSVSRRFIQATKAKLRQLQERSLEPYDLVALFLDGKTFGQEEMILALGITIQGKKVPLGFVQAPSESERVCRQFINDLIRRGLRYEQGLLVVIDGSKGLYSAIRKALDGYVCIQRCQWHKRENIVSYLPKGQQDGMRRKLRQAYDHETEEEVRAALNALEPELGSMNLSAVNSLNEGLDETLTLYRLGMMPYLKQSFRTTNGIESVNSQVGQRIRNVKMWKNSSQRHRWLAAALLDIEPRLKKVKGFRYLSMLRQALQRELGLEQRVITA